MATCRIWIVVRKWQDGSVSIINSFMNEERAYNLLQQLKDDEVVGDCYYDVLNSNLEM